MDDRKTMASAASELLADARQHEVRQPGGRGFEAKYRRGRVRRLCLLLMGVFTGALGGVLRAEAAPAFGPAGALNSNAGSDSGADHRPQVTTDGAGNWVAAWESYDTLGGTIGADADVLVARSTNNGATWTAPAALNSNAGSDSGSDERPQVATDGVGNWVAVWYSTDTLGGTIGSDYDILVARSTDNGATWTAPAALNSNAGSDSGVDYKPQIVTDGKGHWVVVWGSADTLGGTIGSDYDVLVARSTDNGAMWTAPAALNSNAGSDSGHDYVPQVTTDGAGNWVAVWYSNDSLGGTIGTDYDILAARSTDNGATWTAPAALNSNASSDSGHDYNPQVTTSGAGSWVAVWSSTDTLSGTIGTDYDILAARSTDNGATWTAPAVLNSNASSDSGNDWNPQLTTDGAGNWVAVWESYDTLGGTIGADADVLAARSTDNGATWTAPAALNSNAGSDSGDDMYPQLTTDGAGKWMAVWQSYDTLGSTIGTDADILLALGGICGDGGVGGSEQCDDGNTTGGDCCDSSCQFEPSGTSCDDALFCTATDTCDGSGTCLGAGNPCPGDNVGPGCNDSCDEAANDCTAPDAGGTSCDDTLFCTATDTCNGSGTCLGAGNPCPGDNVGPDCDDSCNEAANDCTAPDPGGTVCDDGNACTTSDQCSAATCVGTLAPEACVDHFMCYRSKVTRGTPRFVHRPINLLDQFNAGDFDAKRPNALCAPATVDGSAILDADTHLESYVVTPAAGTPWRAEQTRMTVLDRFGNLTVDTRARRRTLLFLPTSKGLDVEVSPPTSTLDTFHCYEVGISAGAPGFPSGIQAAVNEQFESRLYDVKRPQWLCKPADKDGVGITHTEVSLMCYIVRRATGQLRHTRVRGRLHTNNDFGPGRLDTISENILCVPATTTP